MHGDKHSGGILHGLAAGLGLQLRWKKAASSVQFAALSPEHLTLSGVARGPKKRLMIGF